MSDGIIVPPVGSGPKLGDDAFRAAHTKNDLDFERTSMHHTLGKGPMQAAPGNHGHEDYAAVGHTHPASGTPDTGPQAISLIGGWIDTYAARWRLRDGFMELTGTVQSTINDFAVITYLGVGYRPEYDRGFPALCSDGAFRIVNVRASDGAVFMQFGCGGFTNYMTLQCLYIVAP